MKSSVFEDIIPYSSSKVNCFGTEHANPIFWVKEQAMQETGVKQVASRALLELFRTDDVPSEITAVHLL
jgi:hypothetical protein